MSDLKTFAFSSQTGSFNYPRSQVLDSSSDRWSSSANQNAEKSNKFMIMGPRPWGKAYSPTTKVPKAPSSPELDRPNPFTKKVPESTGPKDKVANPLPHQPFSRYDKGYSSMNASNKTSSSKEQSFGLGQPRNTFARSSLTTALWSQKDDKNQSSFTKKVDIDINEEKRPTTAAQNPHLVKSNWTGNQTVQSTKDTESTQLHRAEFVILREDSSTDSESESHKKPKIQVQKVEDKLKDPNNELLSAKMENLKQRRLIEQKDEEIKKLIKKLRDEDSSKSDTLPLTSNPKSSYHFGDRATVGKPKEKPTYYFGDKNSNLSQKPTLKQHFNYTNGSSSNSTSISSPETSLKPQHSLNQPTDEKQGQNVPKPVDLQPRSIPVKVQTPNSPKVEVPKVIHIPITIIQDKEDNQQSKGGQLQPTVKPVKTESARSLSQSSSSSVENLKYHPYVNLQSLRQESSPASTRFSQKDSSKAEFPRYFRKNADQKSNERPKSEYFFQSEKNEGNFQPGQPLNKNLTSSNKGSSGYTPVVPQPGTSQSLWNVSSKGNSQSLTQSQKQLSMSKPTDLDSIVVVGGSIGHQGGALRPIIAAKTSVNPKIEVTHINEPMYQNLGSRFALPGKESKEKDVGSSSSEDEKVISDLSHEKKSKFFNLGSNRSNKKIKSESSSEEEAKTIGEEKSKKKTGFGGILKMSKSKINEKHPSHDSDSSSDDHQQTAPSQGKTLQNVGQYENLRRTSAPPALEVSHPQQRANKNPSRAEPVHESSSEDEVEEEPKKTRMGGLFKMSKGKSFVEKQPSPSGSSEDTHSEDDQQEISQIHGKLSGNNDHYENLRRNSSFVPKEQHQNVNKIPPVHESSSEEEDDEVFTNETTRQKTGFGAIVKPLKGKGEIKKQSSPDVSQGSESDEYTDSGKETHVIQNMKIGGDQYEIHSRNSNGRGKRDSKKEDSQSDQNEVDHPANLSTDDEQEARNYDRMHNFRESPKAAKKKGFSGLFSSSRSSGRRQPNPRGEVDYNSDIDEHSEPQRSFNSRQRRNSKGFGSLFGSKRKAKRFQQQQRQQGRDDQRQASVYSGSEGSLREEGERSDQDVAPSMSRRRRDTSISGFFGSGRGNPSKAKSMGNLVDQGPVRGRSGSRIGLQGAVSTGSLTKPKRDKSIGSFLGTPKSRRREMQRSTTQPTLNGSHLGSESEQQEQGWSGSEEVYEQRSTKRAKSTSNHDDIEVNNSKRKGSDSRRARDISSGSEESENGSHMSALQPPSSVGSRTNSYRQASGYQQRRRPLAGLPDNFNSLPRMKQREIRQRLEQQQQDDYDDDFYDRQSLQHRRRPRQKRTDDSCSLM